MKNYEKYEKKIKEYEGEAFCNDFVQPYILKQNTCGGMDCEQCNMIQMIWLMKEYEEPEVDWSKVEVDTPILVREHEEQDWVKRYFAKYEGGKVYAWNSGCTSWTTHRMIACMTAWRFAKLAEPEVDWSKVEVDTPILVTNFEDGKCLKRYFAKFEDGKVYAWVDGGTSWSSDNKTHRWKYAKLAESEETK